MCLFTCTLFPPNRQLCWFYPFPSLHGNSFLSGQRALALSLVPGGPVARIHCSHCLGLASVSGRELKSRFEPLQPKAAASDSLRAVDYSWSGLPFPPPGDLSDPGIKPAPPASPVLAGGFCATEPPENPVTHYGEQLTSISIAQRYMTDSVGKRLGGFHVLAPVNSVAMNIDVYV